MNLTNKQIKLFRKKGTWDIISYRNRTNMIQSVIFDRGICVSHIPKKYIDDNIIECIITDYITTKNSGERLNEEINRRNILSVSGMMSYSHIIKCVKNDLELVYSSAFKNLNSKQIETLFENLQLENVEYYTIENQIIFDNICNNYYILYGFMRAIPKDKMSEKIFNKFILSLIYYKIDKYIKDTSNNKYIYWYDNIQQYFIDDWNDFVNKYMGLEFKNKIDF